MFHALWEQEYTRHRFTVTWKNQGNLPQIGDIVLFKNEPIYKNPISAARVEQLLRRKNGDVYGATISYHCEVGGWKIVVDRHLNQLFPFMNLETQNPQETVHILTSDSTEARNLAPAPSSRPEPTQDEFHPELAEINQYSYTQHHHRNHLFEHFNLS